MCKIIQSSRVSNLRHIRISGKCFNSGAECFFYKPSNSKYGIKVYYSIDMCDIAYANQKKLARLGLAPKVGEKVIVEHKEYLEYLDLKGNFIGCGYETEIAPEPTNQIYEDQIDRLEAKLAKLNLNRDLRIDNCGVIKGKLVLVDCGRYSAKGMT